MPKRRPTGFWSRRGAVVVNTKYSSPASNNRRKKVPNKHTIKINHYNPLLVIENLKQQLEECKNELTQNKLGGVTENAEVIDGIGSIGSSNYNRSAPIGGAKHRRLTKRRRHTKRNTKKKQIRKYRKVGGQYE